MTGENLLSFWPNILYVYKACSLLYSEYTARNKALGPKLHFSQNI